jgi:hypothetical protein
MRFRIRHAQIQHELRQLFDVYGETVIALALALGTMQGAPGPMATPTLPTGAMMLVSRNQNEATQWLREKRDEGECHATRLEICEWSILLFVLLSVVLEIRSIIWR